VDQKHQVRGDDPHLKKNLGSAPAFLFKKNKIKNKSMNTSVVIDISQTSRKPFKNPQHKEKRD
jgi:hypothetical protein